MSTTTGAVVLGLRPGVMLPEEVMDRLRMIEEYDLSFLHEKLLASGDVTQEDLLDVIQEYRRFMALIALGRGSIGMISRTVDAVWHQHILFTREYADFCHRAMGRFVHHAPHGASTPAKRRQQGRENFLAAYREMFGEIPAIWTCGLSRRETKLLTGHCDDECSANDPGPDPGCSPS